MTGDENFAIGVSAKEHEGPTRAELSACVRRVASDGDVDAFEVLFTHFAPRIRSYMMRMGASEDGANDLVQDTMANLWRRAGSYRPEAAAVSTWIFTIARNLRIDRLRRERFVEIPLAADREATEAYEDDPALRVDGALIRERMAALPQEQVEVLHLVYFEGLSHSEISARLSLPLGTVKSRLRRALARLQHIAVGD